MIGTTAVYGKGYEGPAPNGPRREFARDDVVAMGKIGRWGDFVTRLLVRLSDGAELFVRGGDQPESDERWLRKITRAIGAPSPRREAPVSVRWILLSDLSGTTRPTDRKETDA